MAVTRSLRQHQRHTDARTRALAKLVHRWLRKYAVYVIDKKISAKKLKAVGDKKLQEELVDLLTKFGLRQAKDAAKQGGFESSDVIDVIEREYPSKRALVRNLAEETRDKIQRAIGDLVAQARAESPAPSPGAVAQRIRAQFADPKGVLSFAVSPGRAARIARTELAQAGNDGLYKGMETVGVKEIEWLSYSDGKSGERHHERMNGKRIKIGERFETPLGNELRFPGDPLAPIKDTIHCRCSIAPARS